MGAAAFDARTRRPAVLAALAGMLAALSLAGCGSIADKFSQVMADAPGIGLPAGTPERPVTPAAYPAVHDMPPARPAALTGAEQIKMEDELVSARNRQQALVGQPVAAPPASYAPAPAPAAAATKKLQPAAPAMPATPSSSSQSIY